VEVLGGANKLFLARDAHRHEEHIGLKFADFPGDRFLFVEPKETVASPYDLTTGILGSKLVGGFLGNAFGGP